MDPLSLAHIIDSRTVLLLARSALPDARVVPSRARLARSRVATAALLRRYADALAPREALSPLPPARWEPRS